jgi:antitoxin HicB
MTSKPSSAWVYEKNAADPEARYRFGHATQKGGKAMTKNNPHIGSSFEDFLAEEGLLEECTNAAIKRVIAWQVEQAMQERGLTKAAMAHEMHTSRAALNRLLDPENTSITLHTLQRAAAVVGKRVQITLEDAHP